MSYIFDTNMFMEDFDVNKYKGEKIYIPIPVLEELDRHNHSSDRTRSYKARNGLKAISRLALSNTIEYPIEADGRTLEILDGATNDNRIIAISKTIMFLDRESVLYTHDLNMYQKAVAIGVRAKHIDYSKAPIYKGYIEVVGTTDTINRFFDEIDTSTLYPNEYILIKDVSTGEETEMRWTGERFVGLSLPDSKVVKAKNALQRCALDLLMNRDITTVAVLGGYGSGKTYLCMQMASYFVLDKNEQSKILGILELCIECPFGHGRVGQRRADISRNRFSGSQIHDLHRSTVCGVAEKQYLEIRGFGIAVHAAFGEVLGGEGLNFDAKCFHTHSFLRNIGGRGQFLPPTEPSGVT